MGRGGGLYQHQYYGYGNEYDYGGMWMDQSQSESDQQQQQHYTVHQHSWTSPPMKPPCSTPAASAFCRGGGRGSGGFGMHPQTAYGSSSHHGYAGTVPGGLKKFDSSGYNRYTEEVAGYDKGSYMEERYGGGGGWMMMNEEEHEDEMRMRMGSHSCGFNPYHHHHNYNNNVPSKPQYAHLQQYYWDPKGVSASP